MATDRQRAARRFRELDTAVPPLTRDLTAELRAAHQRAGCPSFIEVDERNVRAGRGRLTKATLSRIFTPDPHGRDQSLPAWAYYEELLRVLDEDPERYRERQEAAQREWQARNRDQSAEPEKSEPDLQKPAPVRRFAPLRRPIVIGAAVAVVVLAVAAIVLVPRLLPRNQAAAKPPAHAMFAVAGSTPTPTAPLVTGTPPPAVEGTIVRTFNKAAGKSIGVRVYPLPDTNRGGQGGPTQDGAVLQVVCHLTGGRSVHEALDTQNPLSSGWDRVFYANRLWYVSDHYVTFQPGVQPPAC
jgi:hypothetical protein